MNNPSTVILLGASFNTGNLGVSALGWSSIRLLLHKWPNAKIEIVGSSYSRQQELININGRQLHINSWPVRFCSNPLALDHFWKLILGIIIIRFFPFSRSIFAKQQSTLGVICRADIIVDITGGDSFSDIYGMKRFLLGYMKKRLCQLTGKPFIMLPQTYGPFKHSLAKRLAKRVLNKSTFIYSRDKEGTSVLKELIGDTDKIALTPDIAFILDPKPNHRSAINDKKLANLLSGHTNTKLIGLNVSGLLYNDGYTGTNEFGLKCAYKDIIMEIVKYFAGLTNTNILLVPHVVTEGLEVENDLIACHQIRDSLTVDLRAKIFIAEPISRNRFFDQCEIKHIIGNCHFFIGSRMHATIAAISQHIPTVALAYSKKFAGVYETVGIEDCVIDLRTMDNTQTLNKIKQLHEKSENIKKHLKHKIPKIKEKVFQMFDNLKKI